MTVKLHYEFKGYNRVANSMRKLASGYRKETDDTVGGWVKKKRAGLKSRGYPAQRLAPQPFKSERQRRWFFWALASGLISSPYQRSGKLANSWKARRSGWSDWAIENSQIYAYLVVGRNNQAGYHEGHWWVAEDVIEEDVSELSEEITDAIMRLV